MIKLINRGIISIKGEDAKPFLNSLLSNNVDNAAPNNAVFAGLLSPQGKYLFDIFITSPNENEYILDCNHTDELIAKLKIFKLRNKVEIQDLSADLAVYSCFDNCDDDCYKDPRSDNMGYRCIRPNNTPTTDYAEYETIRIRNSIPELSVDLLRDKDFALEGLMDELGAIDFKKGCYIGQEMTSRMKRRTTVKNKLCNFTFEGDFIEFQTPIMAEDLEVGEVRTCIKNQGIALVRLDRLQQAQKNNIKILADKKEITIRAEKVNLDSKLKPGLI